MMRKLFHPMTPLRVAAGLAIITSYVIAHVLVDLALGPEDIPPRR